MFRVCIYMHVCIGELYTAFQFFLNRLISHFLCVLLDNKINHPSIKKLQVWDITTLICIKNYSIFPGRPIYGLATRPQSNTCFASGSMNYNLNVWDENTEKAHLGKHFDV